MRQSFLFLLILLVSASCSNRNLAYFSDLRQQGEYKEQITNENEPKIQPDDLLSISISSLSPEATAVFNRGVQTQISSSNASSHRNIDDGYLVDKEGFIDFPVIGKMKLGGLTKAQAKDKMVKELQQYLKRPTANIRFLNFRVTVVGEVGRPSTFTIPSEKINVLEALGMAGDMTAFGKRDNVLIIREEGGVRKMARLNLNSKETFNSPYFYLQQNDVIYVQPNSTKATQATTDLRFATLFIGLTSTVALIISRLY